MRLTFFLFLITILLCSFAVARDFTPVGNITGRGIYEIYNFTNISSDAFSYSNGTALSAGGGGTSYSAGFGLGLTSSVFSHNDTSSQASINGAGRYYIQDITLDSLGHITSLATGLETVEDTNETTKVDVMYAWHITNRTLWDYSYLKISLLMANTTNNYNLISAVNLTAETAITPSELDNGSIIRDGNTSWVMTSWTNDEGFFNNIANFTGTLTNTKWCKFTAGTGIVCDVEPVVDTDTQLSGTEVVAMVGNYSSNRDALITNATQGAISYGYGNWNLQGFITSYENLTESDVDAYVANNGYLTSYLNAYYNVTQLQGYRINITATTCPTDNYAYGYYNNGTPKCREDSGAVGGGDITSVNTATTSGLEGGADTGDVDLSINQTRLWELMTNSTIVRTLADIQALASNDFHNLGGTDDDDPEAGDVAWSDLTDQGTHTDTKWCVYASGTGFISCNVDPVTDTNTQLSQAQVEDYAGGLWTGNTETRATVTYQTGDNTLDIVVDDMNDDVPEAGDFGNAEDLDANGAVLNDSHTLQAANITDWPAECPAGNNFRVAELGATATCRAFNDSFINGSEIDNSELSWSGDLSGTGLSPSVVDDSHNHVYSNIDAFTEAQLYTILSDVSEFIETSDAATLATLNTGQGANELYDMNQDVLTSSDVEYHNVTTTNISIGGIYSNGTHLIWD